MVMVTAMVPSGFPQIGEIFRYVDCARALMISVALTSFHFVHQPDAQTLPPVAPAEVSPASLAAPSVNPTFRVVPQIELRERFTDNAGLADSGSAARGTVTDATAGLRIDYRAARAIANLDYQVNRLFYGQQAGLNSTQHRLQSAATLEAVEKWLFLDARASISQQNRSAFGVTSIADVATNSNNRIETSSFQFGPNIRGNISDIAMYQMRVIGTETRTRESAFPDTRMYVWNGFVKNTPASGRFGWFLDGNALFFDNNSLGNRKDSRIRAAITYEIDAQLHLSLSTGSESSNLDGKTLRRTTTRGVGLEWSPSNRTQLAAVTQKRFFGNDHLVAFAHRTPLTAWNFISTKEIAASTNELGASNSASVNNLLLDLLASTVPDSNARSEAIQRRFEQTGVSSSSGIQDGFLTVRPFLNLRQEASMALLGSRNTLTLSVGRREQRAIDGDNGTTGIVAPIEAIRQFRANVAWAYRVSPTSTLRLVVSHLHTVGLLSDTLSTTQQLQSLFLVTQLGPQLTASLGLQKMGFSSTVANSYRENVIVSAVSVRF